MPRLSRYFIRSSLVCLAAGFTLGGLILAAKGGAISPLVWGWFPAHMVLLLFGWLVQLSLGVAYWILPRNFGGDRGRPRWAWGSFAAFQIGLILTALSLASPWIGGLSWLLTAGLLLQTAGIALFAVHAWPRIRPAVAQTARS